VPNVDKKDETEGIIVVHEKGLKEVGH